jgi:hypothetical protein
MIGDFSKRRYYRANATCLGLERVAVYLGAHMEEPVEFYTRVCSSPSAPNEYILYSICNNCQNDVPQLLSEANHPAVWDENVRSNSRVSHLSWRVLQRHWPETRRPLELISLTSKSNLACNVTPQHRFIPEYGAVGVYEISHEALANWIFQHRYVRAFPYEEHEQYRIESLCEASWWWAVMIHNAFMGA